MMNTRIPQILPQDSSYGYYNSISPEHQQGHAVRYSASWAYYPRGFAGDYQSTLQSRQEVYRSSASITRSTDLNLSNERIFSGSMMFSTNTANIFARYPGRTLPPIQPRALPPVTVSILSLPQPVGGPTCQIGLQPSLPFCRGHPSPAGIQHCPNLGDSAQLRDFRRRLPSFEEFITGTPALPDETSLAPAATRFTRGDFYNEVAHTSGPVAADASGLPDTTPVHNQPPTTSTGHEPETMTLDGRSERVRLMRPDEVDVIAVGDERFPARSRHRYSLPINQKGCIVRYQQRGALTILTGRLHLSPFGPGRRQVLDLATGAGRWMVEMSFAYPKSRFVGTDIASLFPVPSPNDTRFLLDNVNGRWKWEKNFFDLIHIRDPLFMVQDWRRLVGNFYTSVKPGGWVELSCTNLKPVLVQGPQLRPARYRSGFVELCDTLIAASKAYGTPMDCVPMFGQYLKAAGFVGVTEKTQQFPAEANRMLAKRFFSIMEELDRSRSTNPSDPPFFSMAFGWSARQTYEKIELFRRSTHGLFPYQSFIFENYTVHARKPTSCAMAIRNPISSTPNHTDDDNDIIMLN